MAIIHDEAAAEAAYPEITLPGKFRHDSQIHVTERNGRGGSEQVFTNSRDSASVFVRPAIRQVLCLKQAGGLMAEGHSRHTL